MKLAFSSVAGPDWDVATVVAKAKEYGYDGVELGGLDGHPDLPVVQELAVDSEGIARQARDAGVDIVCLGTSVAFHTPYPQEAAENQARVRRYIESAAKMGCPFVRVLAGEIPGSAAFGLQCTERRDTVLGRVAEAIRQFADHAAEHAVTILIENSGDFTDSPSIWYLVDAVNSPAVRCCWSPLAAGRRGERPTRSIPRLGSKIGLVRLGDAKFGEHGAVDSHVLPGQGDVELRSTVQLLKGIGYRGYLVFDWPKLANPTLADHDQVVPAAAEYLRGLLNEEPVPLTAYKADKFPPRQGHGFAVGQ